MRIEQQEMGTAFSYADFKVAQTDMTPGQLSPLTQRLDTLESFVPNTQTGTMTQKGKGVGQYGNNWVSEVCLAATLTLATEF
jgi:hypothetical protein